MTVALRLPTLDLHLGHLYHGIASGAQTHPQSLRLGNRIALSERSKELFWQKNSNPLKLIRNDAKSQNFSKMKNVIRCQTTRCWNPLPPWHGKEKRICNESNMQKHA